jgi:phosphoribosylformimino-5-aminoimidazole carboxamide ribotide isomerase
VHIIGVIDLKGGQAVHARGGARDRYAPLQRSAGSTVDGNAVTLASHYIDTFGLSTIYVADLAAIASGALQSDALGAISMLGAALWVDAGVTHPQQTKQVLDAGTETLVVGLETLMSFDALVDICAVSVRPVAFSLDLRGGTPMTAAMPAEPPEALARRAIEAGAQSVIVLDVACVGVANGPDFDLVGRIHIAVPEAKLYAGGGVRGLGDLRRLRDAGCAGALVATALHEGRLTVDDVSAASGF